MKVTVVTVSFNAVKTIRQTIESVLSQDFADVEYVIVDGASTDGTLEIIKEYESRLARFVSEPDGGIYDAMNKSLLLATGEFIGFLHADDFFADVSVISKVVAEAASRDVDLVFGNVDMVGMDDTSRIVRYYSPKGFNLSWLRQGYAPPFPAIYARRTLYAKYGKYDLRYPLAADFDWLARMLFVHRASYSIVPHTLVKMRVGGQSSGIKSNIRMFREVSDACQRNGIPATFPSLMSRFFRKALQYPIFRPFLGQR